MNAKQVLFVVPDDNDPHMGILIDHDYIICAECGTIELFTEDYNSTLDADSFRIPGEINLLD